MAKPLTPRSLGLGILAAAALAGCMRRQESTPDRVEVVPEHWTVAIQLRTDLVKTKNVKEIRYFQEGWVRLEFTDKSFTTYSRDAVTSIRVYPGD